MSEAVGSGVRQTRLLPIGIDCGVILLLQNMTC